MIWLYFCANLVVLVGLEIRQWSVAGSGEWHDFDPSVHQSFVVQLLEHPPKRKIKCRQRHTSEGQKDQIQSKRFRPGQVVGKRKLSQDAKHCGWSQNSTLTTNALWGANPISDTICLTLTLRKTD